MSERIFNVPKGTSGVYAIEHIATGRKYIGSSKAVRHRWAQHRSKLRQGTHPNPRLQNAWRHYGESAFAFYMVEQVGEDRLLATEQRLLDILTRDDFNVATVAGRERAGALHTQEAKDRMSAAHAGKIISQEHRASLSAAFKGRVFSEETRAKISAAKTGKKRAPFTEQAKANMSAGMRGIPKSEAHKARISAGHLARRAVK